MKIIITLLVVVSTTAAAADQPPITLEQALENALEKGLAAEEARINLARGKQSIGEGVKWLMPELSASFTTGADSIGDLGAEPWSFRLTLSQPVLDAAVVWWTIIVGFSFSATVGVLFGIYLPERSPA